MDGGWAGMLWRRSHAILLGTGDANDLRMVA
jgi:hypothetical protein